MKKQILRLFLFLLSAAALTAGLNFCFLPNSIARADLHRISTASYDDLFIGTSHGYCAINPLAVDAVTGRKSTNVCMPSEYPIDSYYILKLAVESGHKPGRVIYEWDPGYWMTENMQGNNPDSFFLRFPYGRTRAEYFLAKIAARNWQYYLEPWSEYRNLFRNIPALVRTKLSADYRAYGTADLNSEILTYKPEGFAFFAEGTDMDSLSRVIPFDRNAVGKNQLAYFEKMAAYARKNGIEFTVITLPVPSETYAAMEGAWRDADSYMQELAAANGIRYLNFNGLTEEELDRRVLNYRDYDGHMSGKLAEEFSRILGERLKP